MTAPFSVTSNGAQAPEQPAPILPPAPIDSLIGGLRERAAAQLAERTVTVPIGGAFGDGLRAVYRPPSISDNDRYARLAETSGPTAQAIELLVDTCLRFEAGPLGAPVTVADASGTVTSYSQRLWDLLQFPARTVAPHEVVEAIFGKNLRLLDDHVGAVQEAFGAQGGAAAPGESLATS